MTQYEKSFKSYSEAKYLVNIYTTVHNCTPTHTYTHACVYIKTYLYKVRGNLVNEKVTVAGRKSISRVRFSEHILVIRVKLIKWNQFSSQT